MTTLALKNSAEKFTESQLFNSHFLAVQHLFDVEDVPVMICTDHAYIYRFAISAHDMKPKFTEAGCGKKNASKIATKTAAYKHPNLTKHICILKDATIGKFYTISELPIATFKISTFIQFYLKNNVHAIRKSVHTAMRQMLVMLKDMRKAGRTLAGVPMDGVTVKVDDTTGQFQLIFMRDLLCLHPGGDEYEHKCLVDVASMFHGMYANWSNVWRLTQPEHYFFFACRNNASLDELMRSPYIQADPDMWSLDDLGWAMPMRKWAFCTSAKKYPGKCECDVCTAPYVDEPQLMMFVPRPPNFNMYMPVQFS